MKNFVCLIIFSIFTFYVFAFDISVESIYLGNLDCKIHIVLKNSGGNIPDNIFREGKIKIKKPSIKRPLTLYLAKIDKNKELNSKKIFDYNTGIKITKNESVEVYLENINDSNPANNSKVENLNISSCKPERDTKIGLKGDYEEHLISGNPFDKKFQIKLNNISPPKSVYIYDALRSPQKFLYIEGSSKEKDADSIKIEFLGKNNTVLHTRNISIYGDNDRVGVWEMVNFSDSQVRDAHFFNVKGTLKLKNGTYSQNSKVMKLWVNLVNEYYYYQDWASRGTQIMTVNGTKGPVLIEGLKDDDREGNMEIQISSSGACPSDFPVLKNKKIHFYTTHEDGRIITPQTGYTVNLSDNQSSYNFTMKDLIQEMGLQWGARWYFISVNISYQCYKPSSGSNIEVVFPQNKETNTVNIRFLAPLPLL